MSPLEEKVQRLEEEVERLRRVEDIVFIESVSRRLVDRSVFLPANAKLSDLADVSDTDSASTGQVLKKTSTTWQPGTDNVA